MLGLGNDYDNVEIITINKYLDSQENPSVQ